MEETEQEDEQQFDDAMGRTEQVVADGLFTWRVDLTKSGIDFAAKLSTFGTRR